MKILKSLILFILLLSGSTSLFAVETTTDSTIWNIVITGNLHNPVYKECTQNIKKLYLIYKGAVLQEALVGNDYMIEDYDNKHLQERRFKFFGIPAVLPFNITDYQITDDFGNHWTLSNSSGEMKLVNNNVFFPDILISCDLDKYTEIVTKEIKENPEKYQYLKEIEKQFSETEESHGVIVNTKNNKVSTLKFSVIDQEGNYIENPTLSIYDRVTKDIVFNRQGLSNPFIESNKEILGMFTSNSYTYVLEKSGYTTVEGTIDIKPTDTQLIKQFVLTKQIGTDTSSIRYNSETGEPIISTTNNSGSTVITNENNLEYVSFDSTKSVHHNNSTTINNGVISTSVQVLPSGSYLLYIDGVDFEIGKSFLTDARVLHILLKDVKGKTLYEGDRQVSSNIIIDLQVHLTWWMNLILIITGLILVVLIKYVYDLNKHKLIFKSTKND